MAALASDLTWRDIVTKDVENLAPISMIPKSTAVIYRGGFVTFNTTTGELEPYDGTVTNRACGWHWGTDSVTGNASAPRNLIAVKPGGFMARKAVTGLVTTQVTDYGKKVYISNDNDLTLTGTTATMHVGWVVANQEGVTAGTNAWVYFRNMFGKVGGQ